MKLVKYDRRRIFVLSTVAILFIGVSIGCSKSNESKIIGSWKAKTTDNGDGSVLYVIFNFHVKGGVSKKTGVMIDGRLSKHKDTIIGKYKFSEDKKNISITWDGGNTEIMNVSFPQKNKMLLGKYEMEKTG
jgi:hypothetical protein